MQQGKHIHSNCSTVKRANYCSRETEGAGHGPAAYLSFGAEAFGFRPSARKYGSGPVSVCAGHGPAAYLSFVAEVFGFCPRE